MKQKYWKIQKILSQVFILIIIGLTLNWIGKNLEKFDLLVDLKWIRLLYGFCLILFVILCISTLSSLVLDKFSRPYNPADQQSLARLNSRKKYQLDAQLVKQIKAEGNFVQHITQWLKNEGYQPIKKDKIGIIFEKKTRFYNYKLQRKYHRTFLLYRPLLNVLIIDNILSEAGKFAIKKNNKLISQNNLILISDMKNEEEILSAGAGIVNYVSTKQSSYLYPLFIDINHSHIFYPQDISLLPWYKRLAKKIELYKLKSWLRSTVKQ